MSDLYRLVYTSRNLLGGRGEEQSAAVGGILAASKRNNARVGVTGALLFNAGSFAQVLEGPRAAVETTFERIQRDARHSDVSVLQCEPVAERGFPNWSMAFVGQSARGRALWEGIAHRSDFDLSRVEGDKLFATLLAIVKAEEGDAAPTSKADLSDPRVDGLDVERVRMELGARTLDLRPAAPAATRSAAQAPSPRSSAVPMATAVTPKVSATVSPDVEIGVLRASLDDERRRTTELRQEVDDALIGLAAVRKDIEDLGRDRDIWADRSGQLRSSLQDANAELATKSDEIATLTARLGAADEKVAVVRRQRDIWAERAKALAAAICRDPESETRTCKGPAQDHAAVGREARPSLVRTAG